MLMSLFKSLSSVNQHIAQVGCFIDTEDPIGKQSRFLYTTSMGAALFPLAFSSFMGVLVVISTPAMLWLASLWHQETPYHERPDTKYMQRLCDGDSGTSGREHMKSVAKRMTE